MKLLVPIDGSPASINALNKSIEIAKKYDFSIKIISVVNDEILSKYSRNENFWHQVDGSIIAPNSIMSHENKLATIAKESSAQLLDSIIAELDFSGIEMEKEILLGEPYEKILETAKNENFDLIVMSNRGFSKIKRFFIGSVTQRVISEATCPVLAIHTDI